MGALGFTAKLTALRVSVNFGCFLPGTDTPTAGVRESCCRLPAIETALGLVRVNFFGATTPSMGVLFGGCPVSRLPGGGGGECPLLP